MNRGLFELPYDGCVQSPKTWEGSLGCFGPKGQTPRGLMLFRRKPLEAHEVERQLTVMKTRVESRRGRLEAHLLKRRQALEKALSEFRKTLEHLEVLAQVALAQRAKHRAGRCPKPYLDPALERECLRIRHSEEKLRALLERLASTRARLLAEARQKGARLGSTERRLGLL